MQLTAVLADAGTARRLAAAYARSEMQYRLSFALRTISSFAVTIVDFAAVAVILARVPHIAGWSLHEIALLYGMSAVCFSLAEMTGGSLDFFDDLIRTGSFDRLVVRPLPLLLQVMSERFSLRRLGRTSQGALVMAFGLRGVDVAWSWDKVAVLAAGVASGIAIFLSIFVLSAVVCFWLVEAREATNAVTYGGDFMSSYPLDIFAGWMRRMATFVIPLAFVNYFPVVYVLNRQNVSGLPVWTGTLSPLVALATALVAWLAWGIGVRHYQSTGT